jgi:methyl-accepting chemotaxis protein
MEKKKLFLEAGSGIIVFLVLLVLYLLSNYIHFNPVAFLISIVIFFLARFKRIPVRRFSILTITPAFAFLLPLYTGGFTTALSAVVGVSIGEKIWRKISWEDSLRGAFTYGSAILAFGFLLPPEGNPSFSQFIAFYLIFSIIFPYLFYLPKFFQLKLRLKDLVYISIWEHIFALIFNGWAFLFYKTSTSKLTSQNLILLVFIIISSILLFYLIQNTILYDKADFERKLLKKFSTNLSFEKSMREMEKILKTLLNIDAINIALYEKDKDEVKIIYSTHHKNLFKNPLVVKRPKGVVWKVIDSRNFVYIPDISEEKDYLPISDGTKSEVMFPLVYNKKFLGVFDIESGIAHSFYEDDFKRLEGIASAISGQLETLLNVANLREISYSLDKEAENLASITEEFTTATSEITEKITNANQNLENAKELLQKNFEIIENIGKTLEEIGAETSGLVESFDEITESLEKRYESYAGLKKFQENFSREYEAIKEEFERFLSFYRRIQELIEFMVDYTTKTRLLSLNASIEAARFEEKESGFSIIAEEIGKLAQVGETLTKKMQDEFNKGEETILKIRKGFLSYEELERETYKKMDEISISFDELRSSILGYSEKIKKVPMVMKKDIEDLQNIIVKMGEILNIYEENFKSFEEIGALSEELSSGSEEIAGRAQELNVISTKLLNLVKLFE